MAVILGKGNNYIGAGALISPYYVLTAAHKVQSWKGPETPMKVRLGEWNAQDDSEPYKNVEIDVESITIHPEFNPSNLYNDVALVRLRTPIDLNAYPHIQSVCLPNSRNENFVGQRCWVAGFGKDAFGNGKHSYIMREVDVPVVDTYECQQRLRSTRLGAQFELNKNSFTCAGGEEGKDACSGDGGSPLVCETNGRWTVAGLVAWGIGCAEYGVPGVYANVPSYVDWINTKIY
jgi:secreted trypsin-like serine protease